jgi:nucleotide-binding universal stress UspA family protein
MAAPKQPLAPFRRIVVPTDFSTGSSRALEFAKAVARPGSTITPVHVVDSFPYRYGPPELRSEKRQAAWSNAQLSMARWLEQSGFCKCGKRVMEGDPALAIAEFVAANKSDVVVLSTSGRLHVSRLLLGSVGEEIFREVSCPVFVLGPKCRASRTRNLARLVFATSLEPHSLAALPTLSSVAKSFDAKVSILRAVPGSIPSQPEQRKLREETRDGIEQHADRYLMSRISRTYVAFSQPVTAICNFANKIHTGAIVLGIRKGGELTRAETHVPWAIAHRIIAKATCPVLTIRRLTCCTRPDPNPKSNPARD